MPFKWLGLSVQKNVQLFKQLLLTAQKKIIFFGWHRFSIQNSKLLGLLNSRGFPYDKGKSDQIHLFVMRQICLHATVTSLSQCVYFKVIALEMLIFVIYFTFTAHKWTKRCQTKLFARLSSCFQLRNNGTLGHQNTHIAVCFISTKV